MKCAICGEVISSEPEWTVDGDARHPECYEVVV